MQNSELYRRGVVTPLNVEAELALRDNNANLNTKVDFFEFQNDRIFESLWDKKLFERINRCCDARLRNYGEDIIEFEKLKSLKKEVVRMKDSSIFSLDEKEVISELKRLCELAIKKKMPLFFIL